MEVGSSERTTDTADLRKQSDLEAISRDPDLLLRLHPDNVAIDEAQAYPALFQSDCTWLVSLEDSPCLHADRADICEIPGCRITSANQ